MSDNRKFEWRPGQRGNDVAVYFYDDENGETLFRKVKTETGNPERPKMFRVERLVDKRWITGQRILEGIRKVPFRLPEILANNSVIICEGEKDALAVAELGFSATCCHCGAGTWPTEITPCFSGKLVYILYDIDVYRRKHPEMVAASLWGTAKETRIVDLEPFFPTTEDLQAIHEKDVSDYLVRFATRSAKISGIHELLRQARLYTPPRTC
jgi:putative DNA primase/helicase